MRTRIVQELETREGGVRSVLDVHGGPVDDAHVRHAPSQRDL